MCDFTGGQAHGGSDGKSEAEAISKKGRRWCRGAAVRPRPYTTADTIYHIEGNDQGGSDGKSEAEAISKKGRRLGGGAAVRPRPHPTADTNKNKSGQHGREPTDTILYIRKAIVGHKKYRNYQI